MHKVNDSLFSDLFICVVALFAVKVRAEAMQRASELVPSGMLSVIGRPQAEYKHACVLAKEHCKNQGMEEPVCSVANYLFPDGRVIAGHQKVCGIIGIIQNVDLKTIPNVTSQDIFLFRHWISSSKTQDVSSS